MSVTQGCITIKMRNEKKPLIQWNEDGMALE